MQLTSDVFVCIQFLITIFIYCFSHYCLSLLINKFFCFASGGKNTTQKVGQRKGHTSMDDWTTKDGGRNGRSNMMAEALYWNGTLARNCNATFVMKGIASLLPNWIFVRYFHFFSFITSIKSQYMLVEVWDFRLWVFMRTLDKFDRSLHIMQDGQVGRERHGYEMGW